MQPSIAKRSMSSSTGNCPKGQSGCEGHAAQTSPRCVTLDFTGRHGLRSWALVIALAGTLIVPTSGCYAQSNIQTAVLAGGCFWGMEGLFEHVRGVRDVVSVYAGGSRGFGGYGGQRTGFAEAVRIRFDPAQISYNQLLQIFFDVAHDPTQVDRQGPDVGERYRSAIFPQNAQQRAIAQQYLTQLRSSNRFGRPIATKIESGGLDVAEAEHQDFMRKHPNARYVVINDLPKIEELKRRYPQFWRD
jgi:peptide-methionine (S)-S-oxide reductase